MSELSQSIQYIPLNKLVASPRNVRRKHSKADIEALAVSIHSRGLLQNLCVVPGEKECFEVEAGGRRRLALKLLAKEKKLAKDWPVPCHVVAREDGVEVSLTENIHRVAMDAMDEVDAYATLVAEGKTPDEIARRFGVERRHVEQRLALAGLSPRIKAAWRRGDVSLEAARAFCLVDDHAQQDAVYRSLGKPVSHAQSVRARLMDGRMRATDRLAIFVGLEAYEAAGGKVLRDLFDEDAVFIDSPALMTKLAEDMLAGRRDEWLAKGWSWVDLNLGSGRGEGLSTVRLHAEWRDATPEEQSELDRISGEIEALDADLDANGIDDDPRWTQRDDLEAAYETIRQAARCWSTEVMALSGVMLSIDHDGEVSFAEGLVRTDDQKRVEAFLKQRRAGQAAESECDEQEGQVTARVSALPKAVNRDLTMARTRAIRLLLSGDPDVALALCVASLASRCLHHGELPGVSISGQARHVDDLPALNATLLDLEARAPTEGRTLVDWALEMSRERLLGVLAVLVASTIDLTHEDTSQADLIKQGLADTLAQSLDVDMTQYWQPDLVGFWARLSKSTLMSALGDAPAMSGKSPRTREDAIKAHMKLRRDDLAAKVASAFDGTGYLPEILSTPIAAGALEITAAGAEVLSVPAVAAE